MPSASLSARERRNPPPRRKSCTACVRAKRRCDAALPSCFRCQQRRIPCQYAGTSRLETIEPIIEWQDDVFNEDTSSSSTDLEFSKATDPAQELNDLSFLASCLETAPLDPVQQDGFLMAPVSRNLEFSSDVFKTRLRYAVDVLKLAPTTMVLDTQTPWCHAHLYKNGMPKSMQDAFSSCALYMAKNKTNAPIIFRSIEARIRDLLTLPSPTNLFDSLAHAQALLLYQIIRLFDGDITARSSAEQLIPSLENAALQLLTYVRFDDHLSSKPDLPLYPIQPIKDIWEDWIVQESARRTVLVTFYFLQAYRVLSGHVGLQCDGKLGLCHSWTLSSKLWDAGTTVEFAQAWKARQYYVVTNGQFAQVLQEAKAEDVDSFGRIWISSLLGIEETEGWFAARGGKLQMEMAR